MQCIFGTHQGHTVGKSLHTQQSSQTQYSTKCTKVNAKLATHTDLVNRAAHASAAEAAAEEV